MSRQIFLEYKSPARQDWFTAECPTTLSNDEAAEELAETLDQCQDITQFRVTTIKDGLTADATAYFAGLVLKLRPHLEAIQSLGGYVPQDVGVV